MLELSKAKKLSVFFPLFNEEGNVEVDVQRAIKVLGKLNLEYEILLINDGSKDQTGVISDRLAKDNPKIRAIHHKTNLGYGEALKSGFYNAKYDTICYTDGDGQFDFSEITKFLEKIGDYDLVLGYRIKRQDPFFRILFKKGWKLSLLIFFGLLFKDVDCGFKVVTRKFLENISHLESTRGAMINAELAIKAKKGGFKVAQVGVNHYPRLSGKPTGASPNVIFKSYLDLVRLWWKLKDQKILFILLLAVLGLSAFLRLYKLDEYMTFLGDEGRDAIIVKDILTGNNLPLIGPPTSVGNIYLGPLYYYMMAIPMAVIYLNPIAAAGMNALIGVITVMLIYYLGKIWFGRIAGLVSAYLYTISPITIFYSRSSWNPNPAPFFALLGIWGLSKVHGSGNFMYLLVTGIAFAAAIQMHYLALILVPVGAVLLIYEIYIRIRRKEKLIHPLLGTILAIIVFFLAMSPLFIFDLKHDFLNYKAIANLLTKNDAIAISPLESVLRIPKLYLSNFISRYLTGENIYLAALISVMTLIPIFYVMKNLIKLRNSDWPYLALFVWLGIALLGLTFYQKDIYDHYFGFMNPAPFLLLGAVFSDIVFKKINKKILFSFLIILIVSLSWTNIGKNPLRIPPNNQLERTQDIALFIIRESNNNPFNFALLAQNNYDSAYQFYLDLYGNKPKIVPFEKTEQLFVVCEDQVCDPIYSPKQEIAAFGWTIIEKEWEVEGLKIYKLVHNPEEPMHE